VDSLFRGRLVSEVLLVPLQVNSEGFMQAILELIKQAAGVPHILHDVEPHVRDRKCSRQCV